MIWTAVSTVALNEFINKYILDDDDDFHEAYENLSTYNKFANNNIYIGDGQFIRIPKEQTLMIPATLATALYSAVTGRKVRPDIAMTGEISLLGNVMAIGGLKEKVIAAGQAGIKQVFVPQENEADVEELEAEVVEGLTITKVQKLTDIWKEVFVS